MHLPRATLRSQPSMWHVLHLIAAPVEFLLGVFCVLTAIILYPNEEGKIQSRFEDFWIRVDDYRHLALSKHAAFMTQVAKLETAILDFVFGEKLISEQAMAVSLSLSLLSLTWLFYGISDAWNSIGNAFAAGLGRPADHYDADYSDLILFAFVAAGLGISSVVLRKAKPLTKRLVMCGFVLVLALMLAFKRNQTSDPTIYTAAMTTVLGGFVCDALFIALTRVLLRW